jgi:acyl-CoA reductase-like NAD-dependent aldehyde dehydrogenase/nicotinamidase-related amidase
VTRTGGGAALLLVDLQRDFLERPGLTPGADLVCARAEQLLKGFRAQGHPVAHAHTRTRADGSDRMPHWKRLGLHACVDGSPGAAPPQALAPREGELVCRKQYYSAFADPHLDAWLRQRRIGRIVLAGLYLHACVRSTALDAYERGYEVAVAEDAVGSTEPLHAELSRAWLAERAAHFAPVRTLLAAVAVPDQAAGEARPAAAVSHVHRDPCRSDTVLAEIPRGGRDEVRAAAQAAARAVAAWGAATADRRGALLERVARRLEAERDAFTARMVREVAKPRAFAEEEIGRALAHVRLAAALARATHDVSVAPGVRAVHRPHGVVGLVTPWNNPVAIPLGKLAPALAFGNAVVWKPAPEAHATSLALLDLLARAGLPDGVVSPVFGGEEAARAIFREPLVAAVSLTGSVATGRVAAALCAEAPKPLQAELGGNNAAIVLRDAELPATARELALAAFGFAGQRCTAIRRFVVERAVAPRFEALLADAVRALRVGEPDDPVTQVGPLISADKRDRLLAAVRAAVAEGARGVAGGEVPAGLGHGAWLAPTLLADADPASAIVQEESFGPVGVLQVAEDLEHALVLANGVPQGLLMTVHTRDAEARARVRDRAQAGMLKLGAGPLAIHPAAPFVGWKASGLGPPEHGAWDREFYARAQALYEDAPC